MNFMNLKKNVLSDIAFAYDILITTSYTSELSSERLCRSAVNFCLPNDLTFGEVIHLLEVTTCTISIVTLSL